VPSSADGSARRFVCVHGHFYQPPRENAWLEEVELQESADPYHDWNERITAECYAPNANARILDPRGRIVRVVNNYAGISFDFGPTLLSWLERHESETYRAVLEADRMSRERFSGHGSAMAQVYSHPILPLCNARDKTTQVRWGIRDFERRFGRFPEGMWLPETAVDLDSLEELASQGIRFTILEPSQAGAVRPIGAREWTDVPRGAIDPGLPYRLLLQSGRTIDLFFYDGPISRAVVRPDTPDDRLVHIATDGETYGHHHRFGDMALAFALHTIQERRLARITNYAEYLAQHPPTHEVRIIENTAWSCGHGLGRWSEDCGCAIGSRPEWHQRWRAPLRRALDWLRDELASRFEERAATHLRDPWNARDRYIEPILERSENNVTAFLAEHARRELPEADRIETLELLEMQRHALLMYTSCGWFFDEPSGIETRQVLQYAARAAQLGQKLFGEAIESGLLERLERVPGNLPELADARTIYEKQVRPARFDAERFAADHVAGSLFDDEKGHDAGPAYRVEELERRVLEAGKTRLVLGRIEVVSRITLERSDLVYGFLHLGDHNLEGGVRDYRGEEDLRGYLADLAEAFPGAELSGIRRALEGHLGRLSHSLRTLSRDQQRRIIDRILTATVEEAETVYERVYRQHAPLMRFLSRLDTTAPRALLLNAEMVLNTRLRRALAAAEPDPETLRRLIEEVRDEGVALDEGRLAYATRAALERMLERLGAEPENLELLERISAVASLVARLPFRADLARAEILFYHLRQTAYPALRERAGRGQDEARRWVDAFVSLGNALRVVVESNGEA
jgi:alpha-amylase/alpha-mannosidase (GH57 family)